MKHTPIPYSLITQNDRLNRFSIICINEDYCPGTGKEIVAVNIRRKETAEFIVLACNLHYQLIESLKRLRQCQPTESPIWEHSEWEAAIEQAEDILEKLKGL